MKTPIQYAVAYAVAQQLAEQLRPHTEMLEIVGSLRRKRPAVSDIELLYIPRFERREEGLFDLVNVNMADERIDRWLAAGTLAKRPNIRGFTAWGEKNKLAVHIASGIPVDLFSTTLENWFTSLVIRTGSRETNLKLTTGAQRDGNQLNAYGQGITRADGEVVRAESERHVFQLCGVPYLEPIDR
jgi:DNA polymerase/3'-5' exonuclease PolX